MKTKLSFIFSNIRRMVAIMLVGASLVILILWFISQRNLLRYTFFSSESWTGLLQTLQIKVPLLFVGIGIIIAYILWSYPFSTASELLPIQKERHEINKRLIEGSKEDVIDTIRLGLNQLNEYYVINKGQAKRSFAFSLFAIVVGLITIVFGVGGFLLQQTSNIQIGSILIISGTLLEFIGGAYFFLYRKSVDQMNLYFIQLAKMQDTMLVVKLTQDMSNQERQLDLKEKIVLGLLERSSKVVEDLTTSNKRETTKRKSHSLVDEVNSANHK